jgi:hypothetical protein
MHGSRLAALAAAAVLVASAGAAAADEPEGVHLYAVLIDERVGPRATEVEVGDPDGLRRLVGLAPGDAYNDETASDALHALDAHLDALGFALARVIQVMSWVDDDRALELRYVIRRGPPCTVAAITFAGVDPATASRLRRKLALRPGDRYTRRHGEATRTQLARRLGRAVHLELTAADPAQPGALTLTFTAR